MAVAFATPLSAEDAMTAENTEREEARHLVNLKHPWRFDGECTIYLVDGIRHAPMGISWEPDRVILLDESGGQNGLFRENRHVKEIRTAHDRLLWVNHGTR